MMFRRLYWVLEQIQEDGSSAVKGVYTSIPDLIIKGMAAIEGQPIRLNLVKLDCSTPPLGTWTSPSFEGLEDKICEFVQTDEFSQEHCTELATHLRQMYSVNV